MVGREVLSGDVPTPVTGEIRSGQSALFAVADGIGGHAAGERASLLVANGLASQSGTLCSGKELSDALECLNDEIYRVMQIEPSTRGMGTTVAGIRFGTEHVTVFNVGDSRVYRRRGDGIEQVTRDHVLSQNSAILTNCLGGEDRSTPIEVDIATFDRSGVDGWLVCSDGLSDLVALGSIRLPAGMEPDQIVTVLRDFAFDAGAHDNISVIYITTSPQP